MVNIYRCNLCFGLFLYMGNVSAQTKYISPREQILIDAGMYGYLFALILSVVVGIVLSKSTVVSLNNVKTISLSIIGGLVFAFLVGVMHNPSAMVNATEFGRTHMALMSIGGVVGALGVPLLINALFPKE